VRWQQRLGNHKYKCSAKGVVTTRKGYEKFKERAQKLQNDYVDEMDELTPGTASEIFSTFGKSLINACLSLIKQ
jgi:DNA-binding ferritin-like protein (Dps family)